MHNVILRNLRIDGAGEGVRVQMFSHHIWIDHLIDRPTGQRTGRTDTLDIRPGSTDVSVSWRRVGPDEPRSRSAQRVDRVRVDGGPSKLD